MEEKFRRMAESELGLVLDAIPVEPSHRMLSFIEIMRIYDYWAMYGDRLPEGQKLSVAEVEIIQLGWKLAIEYLFVDIGCGGIPMAQGVPDTRFSAYLLIMRLGRVALLRKVADLIRSDLVEVVEYEGRVVVRARDEVRYSFMDSLEFKYFDELQDEIFGKGSEFVNGWRILESFDFSNPPTEVGAFYGRALSSSHEKFKLENVHQLMEPLIFPWDSGYGVMMGYDALPEVDDHFFTFAADVIFSSATQAGLHPDARLGKLDGRAISLICSVVYSLHIKHATFASIAFKKFKEITHQSLTIWTTRQDMIETICDYTELPPEFVSEAIDAISFKPGDVGLLKRHNGFFMPLLFDMGNGMLLRPVSSLLRNPIVSTLELQFLREPKYINSVSAPRESWFRSHLYGAFMGNRYVRIDGNIKLRKNGRILTDLDGVIFDTVSGEVALFQLKWQDYFTRDVRKLRSKAKNLAEELDSWGDAVQEWLRENTGEDLVKTLRLKLPAHMRITKVFCFGISWAAARVEGYGYTRSNNNVAVCNWPMFQRIRFGLGKVANVFEALHCSILKECEFIDSRMVPFAWETPVGDSVVCFEDLFFDYSECDADSKASE
ncbi:hypothetical protein [Pseudomonas aeruginosa]|uniref:hypothetical protein n=1 Tax=Pseudomonas aeruginosa TaxID=287 RepID=UPI001BCA337B|nr:hypothetical protein [Pseudomonas aeruginosa]HED8873729.1 hypothetical protein [Pseudomonas aeruginosa]